MADDTVPLKTILAALLPTVFLPLAMKHAWALARTYFAGLPSGRSRDSGRLVATLMRRLVLRIDAPFLTVAGVFGLVSDLLSCASASGPFGETFYQSPTVIGVVGAHGLAVLTAGTL